MVRWPVEEIHYEAEIKQRYNKTFFFAYIWAMGIVKDHLTAIEFRYRLGWYILGKQAQLILQNINKMQVWSSHPSTSANSGVKMHSQNGKDKGNASMYQWVGQWAVSHSAVTV